MGEHMIGTAGTSPAPAGAAETTLSLRDLRVETESGAPIVEDVSLDLRPGESLGLVGESGSGKTTTVLSLLGFTQSGARITSGELTIAGRRVQLGNEAAAQKIRGRLISYVPQNPGTALNPSMRIGAAVRDMLRAHPREATGDDSPTDSALQRAGLPHDKLFQRRYPHQLSGGQQQRVCIAVSLVCEPPLVVLDEPTTGLDVVTQARILEELMRLRREHNVAMLYVSHDIAVVAGFADQVAVMYAGRIVEQGATAEVLGHPKHPYTRGLLSSIPDHVDPRELQPMPGVAVGVGEHPMGCAFQDRCSLRVESCTLTVPELRTVGTGHRARCINAEIVQEPARRPAAVRSAPAARNPVLSVAELRCEHRGRHGVLTVAENVSLEVCAGECVALVGESGSGKTTIARTIAGLHPIAGGRIELVGEPVRTMARKRSLEQRRRIQIIFQNPSDALNPRHRVSEMIARPARMLRGLSAFEARDEATRLLELVRLPQRIGSRYPAELSGGERQRVGIARALAAQPELIICDEITSALDVSVQAAVLRLLAQLQDELGLALLFITHDLGVVATVADRVLVLEQGRLVETGATAALLRSPQHPYTRGLLSAAPSVRVALSDPSGTASRGS
jgi:peptide/nickel transport system ATP-binding protein